MESNQRIEGTTQNKKDDREGPVEGKDEEKECVKHAAKLPNVLMYVEGTLYSWIPLLQKGRGVVPIMCKE